MDQNLNPKYAAKNRIILPDELSSETVLEQKDFITACEKVSAEVKSYLTGNGGSYYKGWDVARLCQRLSKNVWAIGEAVKHIARPSKPVESQTPIQAYVLDLRKAANYLNHAADEIEAGNVIPALEVAE